SGSVAPGSGVDSSCATPLAGEVAQATAPGPLQFKEIALRGLIRPPPWKITHDQACFTYFCSQRAANLCCAVLHTRRLLGHLWRSSSSFRTWPYYVACTVRPDQSHVDAGTAGMGVPVVSIPFCGCGGDWLSSARLVVQRACPWSRGHPSHIGRLIPCDSRGGL